MVNDKLQFTICGLKRTHAFTHETKHENDVASVSEIEQEKNLYVNYYNCNIILFVDD